MSQAKYATRVARRPPLAYSETFSLRSISKETSYHASPTPVTSRGRFAPRLHVLHVMEDTFALSAGTGSISALTSHGRWRKEGRAG